MIPLPLTFNGLRIVPHAMAVDVLTVFSVEKIPTRRRRRYYVKRTERRSPGCWQSGDVLYMHPTLVEKLKKELGQ